MDIHDGADVVRRLEAIERKLDLIMERLAGGAPGAVLDKAVAGRIEEVRQLVAAGRKIQAIKEYRGLTGAGLREAKEAVDEMARQLR